jgi:hypothetical protein
MYFVVIPNRKAKGQGVCHAHPGSALFVGGGILTAMPEHKPEEWCGEGVQGEAHPAVKVSTTFTESPEPPEILLPGKDRKQ